MFNKLKYVLLLLFIIGCSISADKTTLDFGSTETSKTLTITVQGAMEWNISCNENWVTVNPDHGQTTGAMTTQSINVIVDRTVLDPGDYEASLMMSTNWNLPCSDVLIKMKVEDKEPPLPPAVEGYIYDKDTNETLAEVFVSVESSSDTSDDSGYYHVEVTTTGLKTIIASKEGYEDYSTEINIIKEMVQHDIYLIAIEGTTTTIVSTSTTTATFIPTTIPTTIPATTSTTTLVTSTIPPDVNIIWLQQEISDEVFPGSVSINHATFTSDTDLENVEFLIAQELQQFVIVEPESIEVITAGEENQVNIVMAAPLDVSFGSWNGPVNAKIGNKTYNQPLKVNVKVVQPSVEDVPEGISIPLADRITMDQVLEKEYVKDEIIIIFNLDANIESIKKIISDIGGVIIGCDLRMNVFQVQIQEDNPEALDQILDILEANTNVESASRHWLIPGEMAIPNDPLFDSWGQETPEGNNWGQELIKLVSAWNIETGKSSVKIGIVDTGFDIYHEDLIGNIDYQHYGYFHDISGRSHGTHVAGTAGAVGNNGKGISGVSWNCSLFVYNSEFPIYKYNILGLPVLETTEATYYTVANMIMNAIDDGANVINLSMGHTFKTLNDLEVSRV